MPCARAELTAAPRLAASRCSTEKNRDDSLDTAYRHREWLGICQTFSAIKAANEMRMCAAAKCSRQGGVVGLYAQRGPPPCSRMHPKSCVHSEASKSHAVAPQKTCVRQQCECVCDEYTLFVLAEWLGIYLTIVDGPSSDQSAVLEASFKRFRLQGLR